MYRPAQDSYPQTTAATGRRPSRPSGKSCVNVRMDEWLFDWIKAEATKGKRSLSLQAEMILAKYADGKIK
jgi:hypothetical protein